MRNIFKRNKKEPEAKTASSTNEYLPIAESARAKTLHVRREASEKLQRYRMGQMSVTQAIAYRINLGEFDCTVEVYGKDYDNLRTLCLSKGYKCKLAVMQGSGDDAQITVRISW